jgi:hypothetical protein
MIYKRKVQWRRAVKTGRRGTSGTLLMSLRQW